MIKGPFAARLLENDLTINNKNGENILVKKDTTVIISISSIHTNEKYWKDAQKFNPDRFCPENMKQMHPLQFLPFGLGSRKCPGEGMALMVIRYILFHIVKDYDIELAMPLEKVEPVEKFVLWARNDISIKFSKRVK